MMCMTLLHSGFLLLQLYLCPVQWGNQIINTKISYAECLLIATCEFTPLQINTSTSPISAVWEMRHKLGWEILLGSSIMVAYG